MTTRRRRWGDGSRRRRPGNRGNQRDREDLLREVCILKAKGLKNKEIAEEVRVNEPQVARLLKKARVEGLVRTVYCPRPNTEMARSLKEVVRDYGVRELIVAEGTGTAGHAAARYFEQEDRSGATVVLDGGLTVTNLVASLAGGKFSRLTIIALCSDPPSYYEASAYELMTRMAIKYPSLVRCEKLPYHTGKPLEHIHRRVRSRARKADFVFLGVGPWQHGFTALEFVRHLGEEPARIRARYRKVACMCGYCALDMNGNEVHIPLLEKKMSRALTFWDLKRLAKSRKCRVILLASTRKKLDSVLLALGARLCNTLVLDEELAAALLQRLRGRSPR